MTAVAALPMEQLRRRTTPVAAGVVKRITRRRTELQTAYVGVGSRRCDTSRWHGRGLGTARRWGSALFGRGAAAVLTAGAMLRLATVLDGSDFGRLYLALTVARLVAAAGEGGMPMVLARLIALADASDDRVRVAALLRTGLRRAGLLSVLLGSAAALVTGLLLHGVPSSTAAMLVGAWAIHLAVVGVVEATLTSLGQPGRSQIPRSIAWVAVVAGSFVVVPTDVHQAAVLFLAGAAAGLATSLLLSRPVLGALGDAEPSGADIRREIGDRWRFTGIVRMVNTAVPVGEAALVAAIVGPAATGTIGLARSFSAPLTTLAMSIGSVAAPELALAHKRGGRSELWVVLRGFWRVVVPLAAVAVIALGLVAAVLAEAVVDGYASLMAVTGLYLLAGGVNLATGPVGVALQMADGERQLTRIAVRSAPLLLGAVAFGGILGGAPGAAIGSLLAAIIINAWCIFGLRPAAEVQLRSSATAV